MHPCMHVCMGLVVPRHIHVYVCIYISVCMYMSTYTHLHMYVYMYNVGCVNMHTETLAMVDQGEEELMLMLLAHAIILR